MKILTMHTIHQQTAGTERTHEKRKGGRKGMFQTEVTNCWLPAVLGNLRALCLIICNYC